MPAKDSHVNARGSSSDRRKRRQFLVSPEAGWGGNGVVVPCFECGTLLTVDTLTVDRIVPGSQGGGYGYENIRPQCDRDRRRQSDAYDYGDGWKERKRRKEALALLAKLEHALQIPPARKCG
jgi:hypothetical protein